jgi:long-chain acyl-CoA synthetase
MYALHPLFATLLVHGDSSRSHLVAIGVVDPVQGASLVSSVLGEDIAVTDIAKLEAAMQNKTIKRAVIKSLSEIAKKNRLNGYILPLSCVITADGRPVLSRSRGFT